MAKSLALTASGQILGGSGTVYQVNVTKVGTGASSWILYDNTTNSGRVLAQGDGLSEQSFSLQGPLEGTICNVGCYLALAGTTNPTITVTYE